MKAKKIIMLTAGALLLGGILISGAAAALGALTQAEAVLQTKSFPAETVSKVNIDLDADDIFITTGNTNEIKITYYTQITKNYLINTDDGLLSIQSMPGSALNKKWYDYIDINFHRPRRFTVELPQTFAAELNVHSDYGDMKANNLKGNMKASVSAGDIEIENSVFGTLDCSAEFGDIELEDMNAETISAKNSCGDIEFDNIAANNLDFVCQFGDISGFINGAKSDFSITAKTSLGDCNLSDQAFGQNHLTAENECGDISIRFSRP